MRQRARPCRFGEGAEHVGACPPQQPGQGVGGPLGGLGPQTADAARGIDHGGLPGRLVAADHVGPHEDAGHQHESLAAQDPAVVAPGAGHRQRRAGPAQLWTDLAQEPPETDLRQAARVVGDVRLQQGPQPGPVRLDHHPPGLLQQVRQLLDGPCRVGQHPPAGGGAEAAGGVREREGDVVAGGRRIRRAYGHQLLLEAGERSEGRRADEVRVEAGLGHQQPQRREIEPRRTLLDPPQPRQVVPVPRPAVERAHGLLRLPER